MKAYMTVHFHYVLYLYANNKIAQAYVAIKYNNQSSSSHRALLVLGGDILYALKGEAEFDEATALSLLFGET
jgi:hypothetical protein